MTTSEERLTTLEKTVSLLQKSSSGGIQELNRNVTMLPGMLSSQQLDIKEIKISQIDVEERLNDMNQRMESGFETLEKRLGALESRFETVNSRLDAHTTLLNEHTTVLKEHTGRFDHIDTLLAQILTRLPEKP
jgi:uncharacterized coiled-coil protein SlyX